MNHKILNIALLLGLFISSNNAILSKEIEIKFEHSKEQKNLFKKLVTLDFLPKGNSFDMKLPYDLNEKARIELNTKIQSQITEIVKSGNNKKIKKLNVNIDYYYMFLHSFKYRYVIKINDEKEIHFSDKYLLNYFEFRKKYNGNSRSDVVYIYLISFFSSLYFGTEYKLIFSSEKFFFAALGNILIFTPLYFLMNDEIVYKLPNDTDYTMKNLQPMFEEIEKILAEYEKEVPSLEGQK